MPEILRLTGVTHAYGRRPVLDDVALTLGAGEIVAVLGPNGAGKSTLLRIAAGRERPDAGTAAFRGAPASEDDATFRAEVACALGPGAHYPDLTVREHLLLVALAHEVPDAEARVADALAEHRLADHAEQFPDALSAGLGQLLSLAATRVRPCALLVLDEPEAHLDSRARAALAERLRGAAADGTAVLLATHDDALAARTADRRLVLTDGTLRPAAGGGGGAGRAGRGPVAGVDATGAAHGGDGAGGAGALAAGTAHEAAAGSDGAEAAAHVEHGTAGPKPAGAAGAGEAGPGGHDTSGRGEAARAGRTAKDEAGVGGGTVPEAAAEGGEAGAAVPDRHGTAEPRPDRAARPGGAGGAGGAGRTADDEAGAGTGGTGGAGAQAAGTAHEAGAGSDGAEAAAHVEHGTAGPKPAGAAGAGEAGPGGDDTSGRGGAAPPRAG